MTQHPTRNVQSSTEVAQSANAPSGERAGDPAQVASADRRDGVHYEADPDQLVKVAHQVKPEALPVQGPVDYGRRGGPQDPGLADVAVTPETASVWEARPRGDDES